LTAVCDLAGVLLLNAEQAGWPPASFFNVNTAGDLARAEILHASRRPSSSEAGWSPSHRSLKPERRSP
jgi:hypothetical protein